MDTRTHWIFISVIDDKPHVAELAYKFVDMGFNRSRIFH